MFLLHRYLARREIRRSWPDPGCPFLIIADSDLPLLMSASAACGGPEHQVFRRIARYVDSPDRYIHVTTYRPDGLSIDDVKRRVLASLQHQTRRESSGPPLGGLADWHRVNVRLDGNSTIAERYTLGGRDFVLVGVSDSEEIYSVTGVGLTLDRLELAHRDPSSVTPA